MPIPNMKVCSRTPEGLRICVTVFQFPSWYYFYFPYMPDPVPFLEGDGIAPQVSKDLNILAMCGQLASGLTPEISEPVQKALSTAVQSVQERLPEGVEVTFTE